MERNDGQSPLTLMVSIVQQLGHRPRHPVPWAGQVNRSRIATLVNGLSHVLFPHQFPPPDVASAYGPQDQLWHLGRVLWDLTHEIHQIREHLCQDGETCEDFAESAQLTLAFSKKLPGIQRTLESDAEAAMDGDPAARSLVEVISTYPGFFATMVYRLAHALHTLDIPLLPRMMTEWAHSRTGIDIHPAARIGSHFFIDHGTGVVIGETTEIGTGVTLYQGVTLGALNFPRDGAGKMIRGRKRHPTIEDDVVVYAEATILGGDTTVGQGSEVGGNVWLTHSIPPFSKVVAPARIEMKQPAQPESLRRDSQ